MAVFRAIENQKTGMRSANTGIQGSSTAVEGSYREQNYFKDRFCTGEIKTDSTWLITAVWWSFHLLLYPYICCFIYKFKDWGNYAAVRAEDELSSLGPRQGLKSIFEIEKKKETIQKLLKIFHRTGWSSPERAGSFSRRNPGLKYVCLLTRSKASCLYRGIIGILEEEGGDVFLRISRRNRRLKRWHR